LAPVVVVFEADVPGVLDLVAVVVVDLVVHLTTSLWEMYTSNLIQVKIRVH
jgi:hypothetical protein